MHTACTLHSANLCLSFFSPAFLSSIPLACTCLFTAHKSPLSADLLHVLCAYFLYSSVPDHLWLCTVWITNILLLYYNYLFHLSLLLPPLTHKPSPLSSINPLAHTLPPTHSPTLSNIQSTSPLSPFYLLSHSFPLAQSLPLTHLLLKSLAHSLPQTN